MRGSKEAEEKQSSENNGRRPMTGDSSGEHAGGEGLVVGVVGLM